MPMEIEALREIEKFFELSLDLLCVAGPDGYFKRVNPAVLRTLGWSESELLERPFLDFVHPDDVSSTLAEIEKLSTGAPTISFENRYRRADGGYVVLGWTAQPDPATGLRYAIGRDVTERKALEDVQARLIEELQTTAAEIFPKGRTKIHHDLLGRVYLQVDSAAVIEHQERQERQREAILKDAGFVAEPPPNAESAAPGASNGDAAGPAADKDSFDVVLTGFGDKKINIIKEVRAITSLGLREAKDLVEGVPKPVMNNCTETQAKDVAAKLTSAGATVELRPAMH